MKIPAQVTLILLVALFVFLNSKSRDIGSGLTVLQWGWPFAYAIQHSENQVECFWMGALANFIVGVIASGIIFAATVVVRRTSYE